MQIVDIEIYSMARVQFYLKHLRRGHNYNQQGEYIRRVKIILSSLGLSLKDADTDEIEILGFLNHGHLVSALHIVSLLRCGASDPVLELEVLNGHMRAANLTYNDLHTTEEQIKNLIERIEEM